MKAENLNNTIPEFEMNVAELFDIWKELNEEDVPEDDEWKEWLTDLELLESASLSKDERWQLFWKYEDWYERDSSLAEEKILKLPQSIKNKMWWSLFAEHMTANLATEIGIAWPEDIANKQKRLLDLQPNEDYIYLYRFWFALSKDNPLINKELHAKKWREGLSSLENEKYASELCLYLESVRPDNLRQELEYALKKVNLIPTALLAELLPARGEEHNNIMLSLEKSLEELNDTSLENYFDNLTLLCSLATKMECNDLIEPYNQYLYKAIETIDIGQVRGFPIFRLIQHYMRAKDISQERKLQLAEKISKEAWQQECNLDYGIIKEVQTSLLLEVEEFEKACNEISCLDELQFSHALPDLVTTGFKLDMLHRVREVQEDWLHREAEKRAQKSKRSKNFWYKDNKKRLLNSWFWAAKKLFEEEINIFHEPELVECVTKRNSWILLSDFVSFVSDKPDLA